MNRNTQAAFERALTNLDPGPPAPTVGQQLDEQLIRQLLAIKSALHSGRPEAFGWVLPKATYDQLRDYARAQAERSGSTWADGVTLLGMHVRSDEHATTIMLELL